CFFFSSRRRHTRFSRDWSSDVCSSDLASWEISSVGSEHYLDKVGVTGSSPVFPTFFLPAFFPHKSAIPAVFIKDAITCRCGWLPKTLWWKAPYRERTSGYPDNVTGNFSLLRTFAL